MHMTLNVPITPDIEAKLRDRAAAAGKDIVTFVQEAVKEKLGQDESFSEILAPVHEAFRKSGMTEQRAMDIFERAREQAAQENHGKSPKAS